MLYKLITSIQNSTSTSSFDAFACDGKANKELINGKNNLIVWSLCFVSFSCMGKSCLSAIGQLLTYFLVIVYQESHAQLFSQWKRDWNPICITVRIYSKTRLNTLYFKLVGCTSKIWKPNEQALLILFVWQGLVSCVCDYRRALLLWTVTRKNVRNSFVKQLVYLYFLNFFSPNWLTIIRQGPISCHNIANVASMKRWKVLKVIRLQENHALTYWQAVMQEC